MQRTLIASVLGGIVLFIWGALSHMVFGIGDTGVKFMPNEETVRATLGANIPEEGFYFFPTPDAEQNLSAGPSGILIYHPDAALQMTSKQLITELITNILSAWIAAMLMIKYMGGLAGIGARVLFVSMLGLFATVAVDIPYWNWYGFPGIYTLGALADNLIGFTLVGVVLAWRLGPKKA